MPVHRLRGRAGLGGGGGAGARGGTADQMASVASATMLVGGLVMVVMHLAGILWGIDAELRLTVASIAVYFISSRRSHRFAV